MMNDNKKSRPTIPHTTKISTFEQCEKRNIKFINNESQISNSIEFQFSY